ncbi:MAG: hypothetical protein FWD13_05815 [Treponema sp.]|nr:hypothetical protein [Treponema sp.]
MINLVQSELAQTLNSNEADYYAARQGFQNKRPERLELLQRRINDEDYLYAAIQRLALVLSKELMDITSKGGRYERQRKKRT